MIRLTYGQANAINSPIIQALFQNPQKAFPFVDGFRLTNLVSQLDGKLVIYKQKVQELVQSLGGSVLADGRVHFDEPPASDKFNEQLEAINQEHLEIDGDPVVPQDSWPPLSLAEVAILNPLLATEETNAKENGAEIKAVS